MKEVVKERKDIVFYLKMLPIVEIHPEAYDKAKAILCADSNEKSLQLLEDAYAKKEINKPGCETTVIDENIDLAKKLGIRGTPAIVFSDGRLVSGAMGADELIGMIDRI
jgi:thiol:disulfide interchange protein DsbC